MPGFASTLLDQRHVTELTVRGCGSFSGRHAAFDQLIGLFFQMLADLFGKVFAETLSSTQLRDPVHDFTGARTRVIPSSMRSKLETSRSRCLLPLAVSL